MVTAIRDPNDQINNAWIFTQDDGNNLTVFLRPDVQDELSALAEWPQIWGELNVEVVPEITPLPKSNLRALKRRTIERI